MKNITYKIYGLGCKVNQYDAGHLGKRLEMLGFLPTNQDAGLVIVNTCTVTQAAIGKDLKTIEKARVENPQSKIAVTGCLPVNYREQAIASGVDYVASVKEVDDLLEQIARDFGLALTGGCGTIVTDQSGHSRYFLKVQDGCQQFCSYCIIPYNRGKLSSRSVQEVIDEVTAATEQGFEEIVLCGIHLGLYGVDGEHQAESNSHYLLIDLLNDLFKIEKLKKVRLSSIEITEVNDSLIDLMKTNRKFARHLHIPLQAGTDRILKAMNRPYDMQFFGERINKLREAVPDVAISTDLIVGFPGETEEDFALTCKAVEDLAFSKVHVFPFSAHEKTPAYLFPGQLDEASKKRRASAMQKINDQLEARYLQRFIGQELEAIVDGRSHGSNYRAKSEYYFDIIFESEKRLRPGELVKIKDWKAIE